MFGWFSSGVDRTGGDGANTLADGSAVHLALYKYDSCPYCRMVFRAIDGLDVNIEYRDTRASAQWRDDHRQRTGRTQVPCLLIDGEPLFESADIQQWLVEHFAARSS